VDRDDALDMRLENFLRLSSVSQKNLQGGMTLADFAYLGDTMVKVNKAFTGGGKAQEDKVRHAVEKEYIKSITKLHRTKLLKEAVDDKFEKVTG
jgi:hypothetical protein